MIIDATDLILGRLASFAAKKALLGEEINIVNSEKAVITGGENSALFKFKREKSKSIVKGPFVPKMPDRFVKRSVKRMLPFKKERGREALRRVKCYSGVPDVFKDKELYKIKEAHVSKTGRLGYVTVGKLCKLMGGK